MIKVKFHHFFNPFLVNDCKTSPEEFSSALVCSREHRKPHVLGRDTPPRVITKAELPDGRVGYAWCSKTEINWVRRIGNRIAVGRAKQQEISNE